MPVSSFVAEGCPVRRAHAESDRDDEDEVRVESHVTGDVTCVAGVDEVDIRAVCMDADCER